MFDVTTVTADLPAADALRHNPQHCQAELRPLRDHDTFFSLIENAPFGVFVVDAQFRLRQVSAGVRKACSLASTLIGCDFAEAVRFVWPDPFASDRKASALERVLSFPG